MIEYGKKMSFDEKDFNANCNIKPSSLMYAFQEVASAHVDTLNLGFDDMIEAGHIWVMTKIRFKIYEKFIPKYEYDVRTFPKKKRGVIFYRDYYVFDDEGRTMAAGMSQWCIINFKTRKIERTDIDIKGEYIEKAPFEDGIGKIKCDSFVYCGKHKVTEADIDRNGHTNNCRYADMADTVFGDKNYRDFTIHFSKETRIGDEIYLFKGTTSESSGKADVAVGKLADGTPVFQEKAR